MTRERKENEPDARVVYADIIDLPHHVSTVHPQMPLSARAAQFSAFAALTGYEDVIDETARLTVARYEQDEQDGQDIGD